MASMQSQAQYVLRTVEERGVRFVQLWFTDVLGRHKAFHVTPAELEDALDEGMTFDGSAIDGFSRTQEADVLARPDLTTFQLLPWYVEDAGVARVFCDIVNIDGTPFEGCPRQQLRRVLEGAHERGYTFFVAPEMEYFYFCLLYTSPRRHLSSFVFTEVHETSDGSDESRVVAIANQLRGGGVAFHVELEEGIK